MKRSPEHKFKHIIFSPHLDDAVYSCGGLIQKHPLETLIITIFSGFQAGSLSSFAWKYLKFCGFSSPGEYFACRRSEDSRSCRFLGASSIHLGFSEAIYRSYRNILFNKFPYNSTKKLFDSVSKLDTDFVLQIQKNIFQTIDKYGQVDTDLYFPLSIGGHIDHQILRSIGNALKKNNLKIKYYEDFPYSVWKKNELLHDHLELKKIRLTSAQLLKKYQALLIYRSQIIPVFGGIGKLNMLWNLNERSRCENIWI